MMVFSKQNIGFLVMLSLAATGVMARGVTPADLVGLTDVAAVTISPNGRFIAYQTHKAVAESDTYQTHWWIVGAQPKAAPIELGAAGDPQLAAGGYWDVRRPVWSAASDQIAYLVLQADQAQVWRSSVDGRVREQMTHNAANVREFVWSEDGKSLLFEVGPIREALQAEVKRRKEQGVLFEEVMSPWEGQPKIHPEQTLAGSEVWVYELASRQERKAEPAEAAEFQRLLVRTPPPQIQQSDVMLTTSAVSPDGKLVAGAYRRKRLDVFLEIRAAQGKAPAKQFKFPTTSTVMQLWWHPNSRELYFLQTSDDDSAQLYGIDVRSGATRRVTDSKDTLSGCSFDTTRTRAACIREDLTVPPEVAVIEMRDGSVHTLTDLNPVFRSLQLAQPVRIDFVNKYGASAFAHVLKPIDYVSGKKYPMVITSYRSRGFLRGGVGDEYPAQVFAANGFVVLSFDRPEGPGVSSSKTVPEPNNNIYEYSSPTSSLEVAVAKLVDQGLIDPQRVGGTGLSNGATTMCYALTNSNILSAAVVSNLNGQDPIFYYLSAPRHRRDWQNSGLGGLPDQGPNHDLWQQVSPALNAKRVTAPILVNAPADEYLMSLQFYHSLRAMNKPIELMIYPDEGHIKKHPKHRYFIYQRNLDWFNFWFQGRERTEPLTDIGETPKELEEQYMRWRKLREMKTAD